MTSQASPDEAAYNSICDKARYLLTEADLLADGSAYATQDRVAAALRYVRQGA